MRLLNAQDDRWLCIESDTSPFQISGLITFAADEEQAAGFHHAVRAHVIDRLPAIGLQVRHRSAPRGYDAGRWLGVDRYDVDEHVRRLTTDHPLTRAEVNELVAATTLERIPIDRPPFRLHVLDSLEGGGVAVMFRIHHAFADGVGFQRLWTSLTDDSPQPAPTTGRGRAERAPLTPLWLAGSWQRFRREATARAEQEDDRARAAADYDAFRARPESRRTRTPTVPGMTAQSSGTRRYDRLSLSLERVRRVGKEQGGTVNDVFLTMAGGAVRHCLAERGALDGLGQHPVVAMVPRSTRRPEHGALGNHLDMVLPSLATHLADPRQRFAAVQAAMRIESERAGLLQRMGDEDDRPYGARQRRAETETGTTAGNLSLSNVPGPDHPRWFAGACQEHNHPMPTLPLGQFVNVTVRRYCDWLDLGVMVDPEMLPDVGSVRRGFEDSMAELERTS